MNDIKVPVEVDPTEDTEWNDILRSHGIIPERPKSPTEELEEALAEAVQRQHEGRLENKTYAELAELEDDEDEDFLEDYKRKRFQEIQDLQNKSRFGAVVHITKPEYAEEVTKASSQCVVFLHMSLSSAIQSRLLSSLMERLAAKYPEVKFTEIPANRCVENYPESNCPTLIIYHGEDIVKQYVTLMQLGGNDCKLADLEKVLVEVGAIKDSDQRLEINSLEDDLEESHRLRFVKKSLRGKNANANYGNSGDEDEDFYS